VLTYDSVLGRWVPVGAQALSPDRRYYAKSKAQSIDVVDPVSGTSREVLADPRGVLNVAMVTEDGIYVRANAPNSPGSPTQLLLVAPDGKSPPQPVMIKGLPSTETYAGYGSGTAIWGERAGGIDARAQIVKIDLATRTASTWFTSKDAPVMILGLDRQGHPILITAGTDPKVIVLSSPTQSTSIPIPDSFHPFSAVEDSHGIWFGTASPGSVWLYTPNEGVRKVAVIPPQGEGTSDRSTRIAGPCT
jgi:hypothetical protein